MRRVLFCLLLAAAGCGGSGAASSDGSGSSHATLLKVAVPGDPFAVAVAPDGAIWTATHDGKKVVRLDPATHTATAVTRIAGNGTALAWAHGSMWAVGWKRALYRLDDPAAKIAQTIRLPRPDQMAADGSSLWVTNWQHNTVSQVDSSSGKPLRTVTAGPAPVTGEQGVSSVAVGDGSVWVVRGDTDTVYRIDPKTGRTQARISVGLTPTSATFADGSLWVLNLQADSVSRIDPATNHVTATITTQAEPASATTAAGAVWVTNFDGDSLTRIDPATNHTREVKVCFGPAGIAATGNTLWVACPQAHQLVRVTA
jgi:YVTN family beta-propeller protein